MLICVPALTFAQQGSGGQAGEFLRYGVGARALAMQGAFTSVSDDASAVYWNPAGIGQLDRTAVGLMYSQLFYDANYQFFGIASPALNSYINTPGYRHSIGLGVVNLQQGDFEGRDQYNQPTGSFQVQEFAVLLPYAVSTSNSWGRFNVGVKPQVFGQTIQNVSGYGFGFDIGLLYQPLSPRRYALLGFVPLRYLMPWRVGVNLKYLSSMTMVNTKQQYPNSINIGVSNASFEDILDLVYPWGDPFKSLPVKILLSYEYQQLFNTERKPQHYLGGEVTLRQGDFLVSLPRVGYQFNSHEYKSGLSYGVGLRYKGMELEYAQMTHADLNMAHHVYLTYHFGQERNNVRNVKAPASYSNEDLLSHLAEYPFDSRVVGERQGVDTLYKDVVAENLLYRAGSDTFLADRYDRFIGGFRRIDSDVRAAFNDLSCHPDLQRFLRLKNRYEGEGLQGASAGLEQLSSETYFESLGWYLKVLLMLGKTDSVRQIVQGEFPSVQNPEFRVDDDARNYYLAYATKQPEYCDYIRQEYQPDNVYRDIFMSVSEAVYTERGTDLDSLLESYPSQVYQSHRGEYEPFPLLCDGILADDIMLIRAREQAQQVRDAESLRKLYLPIVFELPHTDIGKVLIRQLETLSANRNDYQATRQVFDTLWERYRELFLENKAISAESLLEAFPPRNV